MPSAPSARARAHTHDMHKDTNACNHRHSYLHVDARAHSHGRICKHMHTRKQCAHPHTERASFIELFFSGKDEGRHEVSQRLALRTRIRTFPG
jgi:hypothetical protein